MTFRWDSSHSLGELSNKITSSYYLVKRLKIWWCNRSVNDSINAEVGVQHGDFRLQELVNGVKVRGQNSRT